MSTRSRDRPQRSYNNKSRNNIDRTAVKYNRSVKKCAFKPITIDLRPSGILTKYMHITENPSTSLKVNDIGNKYTPPEDEIVPDSMNCKIHLFKYNKETDQQVEIPVYSFKSYFVIGRDEELSDIVISTDNEDGGLVSKQHAVLQFKKDVNNNANCYLLDLKSTNGTFLNDADEELPSQRYIQMKNNDFFRLGDPDSVLEFMIIQDE